MRWSCVSDLSVIFVSKFYSLIFCVYPLEHSWLPSRFNVNTLINFLRDNWYEHLLKINFRPRYSASTSKSIKARMSFQAIILWQVWALYDRSHKMLVFLLAFTIAEVTVMTVLVIITVRHFHHELGSVVASDTGCSFDGMPLTAAFLWAPALVFEPILCGLVVRKSWKALRRGWASGDSLFAILARDRYALCDYNFGRMLKSFLFSLIYFVGYVSRCMSILSLLICTC